MKEQDKTLKQALQKAASEGAIAEDPSVEITPSAELDKKMNAFFDSVESQNAESTEQQYTSDKTELSEITTVTCFWMHSKATSRIMIATMMIPIPLNTKIRVIQMQSVSAEKSAACSFRFRVELSA